MRTNIVTLVVIGSVSISGFQHANSKEPTGKESPKKEEDCSTLSEMGIDFGAAELGRFAELGLSDKQKRQALGVVQNCKPKIENLCERMTEALGMNDASLEKKKSKEKEITAVVAEFESLQKQIMTGLHAILTKDQMTELAAMRMRERLEEAKAKGEAQREKEAAG